MSLEGGSLNSPYQSLESLKSVYKDRLDAILNKQLRIDNIETFADESLNETISLTDEILEQYKNNPEFNSDTTLDTQQQEDAAFKILELPNIQEVLQSIIDVRDKIQTLKEYINTNTENIDEVITPPQPDYQTEIVAGSGEGMEKKMFPRLLTLLYIIEHDFDIEPSKVSITKGTTTSNMMRKTPYVRVEIPDLERAVYICDEEGNASYIFDTEKLKEKDISLEELDKDDKGDKNSLVAHYPGIGIRVVQSNTWRTRVSNLLGEPIPEIETDGEEQEAREERKIISEFKRRRGVEWPSFDQFQSEVREFYPGEGEVGKWYRKERKNHPNWYSHPDDLYRGKGWEGWSALVGIEHRSKKEYLSFKDFQDEVRSLYFGETSVSDWYSNERKNHQKTWPVAPYKVYKDRGWIGWSELVGKENPSKKEFLNFESFQAEVMDLYPGEGSVQDWYNQESDKHPNWPADPRAKYEENWEGWSELVGRENQKKKEYLSFEDFEKEVRALYPGDIAIQAWYKEERKRHKNWPYSPYKTYKGSGFIGLPELIGVENPYKKEFLPFIDFKEEVKKLYPGKGSVHLWYIKEQLNHDNWPSNPNRRYKDSGWIDWSDLVGQPSRFKNK